MGGGAGCATVKESVMLGVAVGATSGALANDRLAKRNRKSAIIQGAALTGLLGGLSAYWIHKEIESREEKMRRKLLFDLDQWGFGN